MDISLLTLLIGLALGTFALGFLLARMARLSKLSSPAHQLAAEGAPASGMPATPEPAEVLTDTQLHYQQTHINSLNTNIRILEEKLRWVEQDKQEAEDFIGQLQQQLKTAKSPLGDETTQREAELALLRAQLDAAINNASKLQRKVIRAEHDTQAAVEENQQLRARVVAQQSTDQAVSRLQDRQTALQAAINENQFTRDKLAAEVDSLQAMLAGRATLLAEREAALLLVEQRLKAKDEAYADLAGRENNWEKQMALLADAQAHAAVVEVERGDAQQDATRLRSALNEANAQLQMISERLHALHEAMALRDGQVTELHGELRRLQLDHNEANETLADLRNELVHTVAAAEENQLLLRMRDAAVAEFQAERTQDVQQRETLEAALLLATENLESLREQLNDAEAGRMLLEAALASKTQAFEIAHEDLAQLSSREYELTVALERSGREHQSSIETILLHVSKVEADLSAEIEALKLTRDSLQAHLQAKVAVLATAEAVIASMRDQLAERDLQLGDLRILAAERGRELETAQAQITYLSAGLGELNDTANEKFAALQAAEARIEQLIAERDTLAIEFASMAQAGAALADENAALHAELAGAMNCAADLQAEIEESQLRIEQMQVEMAAIKAAGDLERANLQNALKEQEELAASLEEAWAAASVRLAEMQLAMDEAIAGKTHALEVLEAQASEIIALANVKVHLEGALKLAEARVEDLVRALETAGERITAREADLQAQLQDNLRQSEHMARTLDEMRQAHALLLQEHDALRRTCEALEAQTRNQMDTLVEMSDATAKLQRQLQEREAALLNAQVALAQAQQAIAAKPEPGTLDARLVDTTLTLQRLEREFAALQAEKDAIEDEYTREGIAGQMRLTEKEHELRACGARVDALELEIALLKQTGE